MKNTFFKMKNTFFLFDKRVIILLSKVEFVIFFFVNVSFDLRDCCVIEPHTLNER